jgi:hypothetical protein
MLSLNFDTLKLNWVTKISIFRISGINFKSHLGADLSILGAKKRFRGVKYPLKKRILNLGILFWVLIWARLTLDIGILPIHASHVRIWHKMGAYHHGIS